MDTLLRDIKHALRAMRRAPGFTAVATVALALGIGANTAIYSVVNGVLLRPLPYGGAERVVQIWNHWEGWPQTWLSPPEYWDFVNQSRTLEHVAAYTSGGRNLTGGDAPERVRVGFATANVFPALGAQPRIGRAFGAEEDRPNGPRVAVLGWGLWQRRFAGDPGIIGRTILLNDSAVTVLGVMPPGFQLPTDLAGQPMDLWMPLQLDPAAGGGRGGHYLYAVARTKPGVGTAAAAREVEALAKRMTEQFTDQYSPAFGSEAVPVAEEIMGKVRPALLLLAGAVGFVLLIACANVANLLLARAESRQREIAVRVALGAGRGRIVRQLLTESVLLALAGGALGTLLATWGVGALRAAAPASVPRAAEASVDGTVLGFTLLVSLATGVLFGLVPALQAGRMGHPRSGSLQSTLREGGRGNSGDARRQQVRRALVVAELSLALVLLVGAGLLVRSFSRLLGVSAGFDPSGVLTMQVTPPASKYASTPDVWRFYRVLFERLGALPGVQAAAGVRALPMTGPIGDWGFQVEGAGAQGAREQWQSGDWQVVTPGYFDV
ncbi:MAG TPA: ADOP family duplicated permease, partial [Gemmatimonadaceae bacterium]|nr:ADOP family duplicated permease [Gemmatimonadaceae bacterium]